MKRFAKKMAALLTVCSLALGAPMAVSASTSTSSSNLSNALSGLVSLLGISLGDIADALPDEETAVNTVLELKKNYNMSTITEDDIRALISQAETEGGFTVPDTAEDYVVQYALAAARKNPSDDKIRDAIHNFYVAVGKAEGSSTGSGSGLVGQLADWLFG